MWYQVMSRVGVEGEQWVEFGRAVTLDGARQVVDFHMRWYAENAMVRREFYILQGDKALTPVIKSLYQVREGWPATAIGGGRGLNHERDHRP